MGRNAPQRAIDAFRQVWRQRSTATKDLAQVRRMHADASRKDV
jgi:hypothetical protein